MKALPLLLVFLVLAACSAGRPSEPEWLPETASARADYAVFALRCSKCHSLVRPLNSGIDTDAYWAMYVEKMRRQPGSGISAGDAVATLRFLHLYALEQRRKKGASLYVAPPEEADASAPPRTP